MRIRFIKTACFLIALTLGSCSIEQSQAALENKPNIEPTGIPIEQFSAGVFMGYYLKVTDSYQAYCQKKGILIDKYLSEVNKVERDLYENSMFYIQNHPESGLSNSIKQKHERILAKATEELDAQAGVCEQLQQGNLNYKVQSFQTKQPEFAEVLLNIKKTSSTP